MTLAVSSIVLVSAELIAVLACGYLGTVALVRLRQARGLEFNRLSAPRILVVVAAVLWVICLALQSPALFGRDGVAPLGSAVIGYVCAAAHVLGEGLAEPIALLLPLFTFRFARRAVGHSLPRIFGRQINLWSFLASIPLVLIHTVLVIIGFILFTEPALTSLFLPLETAKDACSLPLASTVVQSVFVIAVLVLLNLNSHKYSKIVINKRLLKGLYITQWTLSVALPVSMLARVASAISAGWLLSPFDGLFYYVYFFFSTGIAAYLIWYLALIPARASLESPLKRLPEPDLDRLPLKSSTGSELPLVADEVVLEVLGGDEGGSEAGSGTGAGGVRAPADAFSPISPPVGAVAVTEIETEPKPKQTPTHKPKSIPVSVPAPEPEREPDSDSESEESGFTLSGSDSDSDSAGGGGGGGGDTIDLGDLSLSLAIPVSPRGAGAGPILTASVGAGAGAGAAGVGVGTRDAAESEDEDEEDWDMEFAAKPGTATSSGAAATTTTVSVAKAAGPASKDKKTSQHTGTAHASLQPPAQAQAPGQLHVRKPDRSSLSLSLSSLDMGSDSDIDMEGGGPNAGPVRDSLAEGDADDTISSIGSASVGSREEEE